MLVPAAMTCATAAGAAPAGVFAVAGGITALLATYLLTLSVAAWFHRPGDAAASPGTRVVVLVPAHDEALLIARCVRSLVGQTYPRALYEVVVVADNCTDDTAALAGAAGARVLVRDEPDRRGKGRALRWALDRVLAEDRADAVAIVDADAVADPAFLSVAVGALERGARAVQAEYRLAGDGTLPAALRAVAFLLFNCVRPAGRAALGLPCHLTGSGMLLSRDVLLHVPWSAFASTEDLEYTLDLRMVGVAVTYAGGAGVVAPVAPNEHAAAQQQQRWEGGKAYLVRTRGPGLVRAALRRRRVALLDAALELAFPPLSVLAATAAAGAAAAGALAMAAAVPAWVVVPWGAALAGIGLHVVVGLAAAGAPVTAYRALALAPLYVPRKLLRSARVVRFSPDTWVRTERAGEGPR